MGCGAAVKLVGVWITGEGTLVQATSVRHIHNVNWSFRLRFVWGIILLAFDLWGWRGRGHLSGWPVVELVMD